MYIFSYSEKIIAQIMLTQYYWTIRSSEISWSSIGRRHKMWAGRILAIKLPCQNSEPSFDQYFGHNARLCAYLKTGQVWAQCSLLRSHQKLFFRWSSMIGNKVLAFPAILPLCPAIFWATTTFIYTLSDFVCMADQIDSYELKYCSTLRINGIRAVIK